MDDGRFFQQALSRFTHEFANGDLIRKYADKGYSISEIKEHLEFKSSREQIHEIMWKHFLATNQILYAEPGQGNEERYEYVKDISPFGKVSFRKVKIVEEQNDQNKYVETPYNKKTFSDYLVNPGKKIYVEIPFGLLRYRDKDRYQELLDSLKKKDAQYIEEIFIERRLVYYRLNARMAEILIHLLENDFYHGKVYIANE